MLLFTTLSLLSLIEFVFLCQNKEDIISCPCGITGETVTVFCESELDSKSDFCQKFQFCESCSDYFSHCSSCPSGRSGPYCTHDSTEINGTFHTIHERGFRDKRSNVIRGNGCPDLHGPKLGSIRCWFSRRDKECTGKCLPGHFFANREVEEIVLRCQNERWYPASFYPPCVSEGLCELEMIGAGSYNCTTGSHGTRCDIRCSSYPNVNARFSCFPGQSWEPRLPHCAKAKEEEELPDCKCQNGGICDSYTGSCDCPLNYQGRYCERYASEEKAYCRNPGPIANGHMMDSNGRKISGQNLLDEKSSVIYTCKEGFTLVGTSLITCLRSGSWSDDPPVCRRIQTTTTKRPLNVCRDPGQILNGERMDADGQPIPWNYVFQEKSMLVFSCRDGFALVGTSFLTCLSSGSWSAASPSCQRIGRITTTSTSPPEPRTRSCPDPGFISNGNRWNADGSLANSQKVSFGAGSSVVFSCKDGFALHGLSLLACLPSGKWSRSLPQCKEVSGRPPSTTTTTTTTTEEPDPLAYCEDPGTDPNGDRTMASLLNPRTLPGSDKEMYPEGVKMEYTCQEDFVLEGKNIITCLKAGYWSDPRPYCEPIKRSIASSIVYCSDPGYVSNSKREVLYSLNERRRPDSIDEDDDMMPEGAKVEFTCDDGLELIGMATITCLKNRTWSGPLPECHASCGVNFITTTKRIIRGTKTTAGDWPWQVAIASTRGRDRIEVFCGGALINPRTVITAAHCIDGKRIHRVRLYFGKYHLDPNKDDRYVEWRRPSSFVIHPNYNPETFDFDIAIIRFAPEIKITTRIHTICLPTPETTSRNLAQGRKGYVVGWGLTEKDVQPESLLMAQVPFVPTNECMEAYAKHDLSFPITENMLCAGYKEGKVDSCTGDSGGPLSFQDPKTKRFVLEGLVSYGVNGECAKAEKYTVYTKVGNFLKWIRTNI